MYTSNLEILKFPLDSKLSEGRTLVLFSSVCLAELYALYVV